MMLHELENGKLNIAYRNIQPEDGDRFLCYLNGSAYVKDTEGPDFACVSEVLKQNPERKREDFLYLFSVGEARYFSLTDANEADVAGLIPAKTMDFRKGYTHERAYPCALGGQIVAWYRKNRFCGRCGQRTVQDEKERMMRCPACGNLIFPQICPSVIIGILHNGKMLLTKYSQKHIMIGNEKTFKPTVHYALVAGYVESGETPEEAVARETMEEVGLRVKNIQYYKSQPWPFSGSLLFGYFCELDGTDEIRLEENELSAAEWKTPEEMPDRSTDGSLTAHMMECFRLGQLPEMLTEK